jgi:hypothetical protein
MNLKQCSEWTPTSSGASVIDLIIIFNLSAQHKSSRSLTNTSVFAPLSDFIAKARAASSAAIATRKTTRNGKAVKKLTR